MCCTSPHLSHLDTAFPLPPLIGAISHGNLNNPVFLPWRVDGGLDCNCDCEIHGSMCASHTHPSCLDGTIPPQGSPPRCRGGWDTIPTLLRLALPQLTDTYLPTQPVRVPASCGLVWYRSKLAGWIPGSWAWDRDSVPVPPSSYRAAAVELPTYTSHQPTAPIPTHSSASTLLTLPPTLHQPGPLVLAHGKWAGGVRVFDPLLWIWYAEARGLEARRWMARRW